MKRISIAMLLIMGMSIHSFSQKPVGVSGSWKLLTEYSDEFNSGLNKSKWDTDINDWGVWSWEPENVWVKGGSMHLKMINKKHTRGGKTLYFKSGAARQKKTITYGYFEARVKGCSRFPGVCPSFWMYSVGQPLTNGVKYNEIDFMEIQQRQKDVRKIDCNLHYIYNGKRKDPKNLYKAPFDPRKDYHVYGCHVTPSKITFYIDGKKVASNENKYFFLKQQITLSMGVRPPFMKYVNKKKVPVAVENASGFPTEMLVDYVRVWKSKGKNKGALESSDSEILTPLESELHQNYPNPTNYSTTIGYDLATDGLVKLTVYDYSGRLIATPVHESQSAGSYAKTINASELGAAGVYIYRLETGGKVITKKMIVR